jgi:hypothetical protein
MSFRSKLGLILCYAAAWNGSAVFSFAQAASPGAQFNAVPVPTPVYATNPYVNYNGPVGGYLSGAADVVNSQGQFMQSQQQAYLTREQVKQASIESRRKNFDEHLYERANAPTLEDERERARLENLRRSRNDPPITEIWSGKALNDLLLAIQQQLARNVQGPSVPLEPSVVSHINVTGSQTGGSLGLLRQDGRLDWPFALRTSQFQADRDKLNELAYQAYKQAGSNSVQADTVQGMSAAVDSLTARLKRSVDDISANDYIKAKRFLNELNDTITILQDPNVSKYVNQTWSARGDTVEQLTREMTRQGLRFARATTGDQAAYVALHSAMVAFYVLPNRPWDPQAR